MRSKILNAGFSAWRVPHLYLWTVLWGAVMLLPQKTPSIVYVLLCALHGFLYGILYTPAQALLFGLDFKQTMAWIAAGLPWDVAHGISNLVCGILISPIIHILKMAEQYSKK